MSGATTSVEGVFADFLTPILLNIEGETTREGLIKLHELVSGNAAPMSLNLGGGRHRHLVLTLTSKDYAEQMGFMFVLPHNPVNYPLIMGKAKDQALGPEKFQQNQVLF